MSLLIVEILLGLYNSLLIKVGLIVFVVEAKFDQN